MTLSTVRTILVFTVISVALVVTGANFAKHQDVLRHLSQAEQEIKMQTLETTWTSDGLTMTLRTPRQEDETVTCWTARHKEALDAAKAVFPVDPPAED